MRVLGEPAFVLHARPWRETSVIVELLTRDEENLPETLARQVTPFRDHLLGFERDAEDRIVPRKSAIAAIVDALVRKIERGK